MASDSASRSGDDDLEDIKETLRGEVFQLKAALNMCQAMIDIGMHALNDIEKRLNNKGKPDNDQGPKGDQTICGPCGSYCGCSVRVVDDRSSNNTTVTNCTNDDDVCDNYLRPAGSMTRMAGVIGPTGDHGPVGPTGVTGYLGDEHA